MVSLIHPDLLGDLHNFYPSRCTIQQDSGTAQNSYGALIASWTNLAGHQNIPCEIYRAGGVEVQQTDMTVVTADFAVQLAAYCPTITTRMRAVIKGATYDILSAQSDSQAQTTRLLVKVVST